MERVRVVVVGGDVVFRRGVRSLLSSHGDIEVAGDAASAAEVAAVASKAPVGVLLVRWMAADGVTPLCDLKAAFVKSKLIVLTDDRRPGQVRRALEAGVDGYVLLRNAETELIDSVRCVGRGGRYLDGEIGSGSLREILLRQARPLTVAVELSSRESEVVGLLAGGRTHKEVAELLQVSTKSVETYRSRAVRKLGLTSRTDLVAYAIRQGLLRRSDDEEALPPAVRTSSERLGSKKP